MFPRKPRGSTYSTSPALDTCVSRGGLSRAMKAPLNELVSDEDGKRTYSSQSLQCHRQHGTMPKQHRSMPKLPCAPRCEVPRLWERHKWAKAILLTWRVPCASAASACSACSASEGVTPERADTSPTVTCKSQGRHKSEDHQPSGQQAAWVHSDCAGAAVD